MITAISAMPRAQAHGVKPLYAGRFTPGRMTDLLQCKIVLDFAIFFHRMAIAAVQ
jgi:hypothetical protein